MTPLPEQNFEGWERPALRDLAQVLAWPTEVSFDNAGRLRVQNYTSTHEWALAHIRGFDYSAGAGAAFRAEQEDARLAGFETNEETFYSYQAYMAVNVDASGQIVEKRFRWLADTWILGVDVRDDSPTAASLDPRLASEELLSLAVNRGMPPPPSHVPTPNPTWALPPVSSPTATACSISFTDVPQDFWAHDYISLLACEGTVSGYNDGTFRPESPTTRAQLAKMLVLSQHWQLVTGEHARFRDVSSTHPFYRYVETAAAHGVIAGYSDGMFRPDSYVTRAQVAKMFVIARGWVLTNATVPVCDVGQTDWAWYYVQTALQRGLFTGYTDSCFRPSMEATRAQLAKVLALSSRD